MSTTTVDAYRGLPLTTVDENGKTTTTEYDAMRRLTKVWRPDRPKAANPNSPSVHYEYAVFPDKPSFVKTTTPTATTVVTTYTLYDGLGRQILLRPGFIVALVVVIFSGLGGIVLGICGFLMSNTAWAHLRNAQRPRTLPLVGQIFGAVAVFLGIVSVVILLILGG